MLLHLLIQLLFLCTIQSILFIFLLYEYGTFTSMVYVLRYLCINFSIRFSTSIINIFSRQALGIITMFLNVKNK